MSLAFVHSVSAASSLPNAKGFAKPLLHRAGGNAKGNKKDKDRLESLARDRFTRSEHLRA